MDKSTYLDSVGKAFDMGVSDAQKGDPKQGYEGAYAAGYDGYFLGATLRQAVVDAAGKGWDDGAAKAQKSVPQLPGNFTTGNVVADVAAQYNLAYDLGAQAGGSEEGKTNWLSWAVGGLAVLAAGVGVVALAKAAGRHGGDTHPALAQANPTGKVRANVVKVNAGNDPNGNPRRAYVLFNSQGIIAVIDEGYEGRGALYSAFGKEIGMALDANQSATIPTTVTEYRELLKNFPVKPGLEIVVGGDEAVLHIAAKNDDNGNPRRAYVVFRNDGIAEVINEGYSGLGALPKHMRGKVAARIATTPAFYRELLREFKKSTHNPAYDENPANRRRIIGTTGDVNMFDYDAGVVYDAGYGPEWEWWYWDNEDDDDAVATATVYRDSVPDDVWDDKNWAEIEAVASSSGQDVDELRKLGTSRKIMDRVSVLQSIEGHYGPHNLDDSPLQLTRAEMKKRWGRVNPRKYFGR